MPVCNNCLQPFEGSYCSHCGQKASVGRLSMHEVFHDFFHAVTHADKGLLRVLRELLFSPGVIYRQYFSGKRKSYFSPVTFFLLVMGLALIIGQQLIQYDRHVHHIVIAKRNDPEQVLFGFQKIRYLLFIPLISALSWLFFYRKYNYAECLAFWFFCMGMVITVELFSYGLQFLFIKQRYTIHYFTDWLVFLMTLWHLFAVFTEGSWQRALACLFLGICSYFLLVYIFKFLGYLQGYSADFNFFNIIRDVFS
jgi:Protein of unknown function (DUF3667)